MDNVLGQYKVIRKIGDGAFGTVKLAVHTLTGTQVALKYIDKHEINIQGMRTRVMREIEYLRMLKHPHIIKLYEVINTPTHVIMVTEYLAGELFNFIVENGRLEEVEARKFLQQIMYGLAYAHSLKIVHRDLKPENVLLDDDLNVKLADFGLSNEISDGEWLATSCGSPNYAAPEIISGKLYAGPEVDVWSVGVVLYVMVCGRLPFEESSLQLLFEKITSGTYFVPDHLSPDLVSLINGMLTVDPMKRLTVPDVLKHPWVRRSLPAYLKHSRQYDLVVAPPLDSLASLLQATTLFSTDEDVDAVSAYGPGMTKLDPVIVAELSQKLGVDKAIIEGALDSSDGENAVKVAYALCSDRINNLKVIQERYEPDEEPTPPTKRSPPIAVPKHLSTPFKLKPSGPSLTIQTLEEVYEPKYDHEDDEGYFNMNHHEPEEFDLDEGDFDDGDDDLSPYVADIDWSVDHHFALLNSSLVRDDGSIIDFRNGIQNGGPQAIYLPSTHHLARYANHHSSTDSIARLQREAQSRRGSPTPSGARTPRGGAHRSHHKKRKHIKPPLWHFGIRSSSPPMEVMHELYKTLKSLHIEWKEKDGIWANNPSAEYRKRERARQTRTQEDVDREDADIYSVDIRWRKRDSVILMALKLYQTDAGNYLVDFVCLGHYKTRPNTDPNGPDRFDRDDDLPTPEEIAEDPLTNPLAIQDNWMNPFLFFECACELIIELAGGGEQLPR